jgi:hypothetical protein
MMTNLPLWIRNGSLLNEVSLTPLVKDAMHVVKGIGERYLWVDSLCIVQDDSSEKHRLIQQMDVIYHNSLATIVALAGVDAVSPLAGVRDYSRQGHVEIAPGLSIVIESEGLHDAIGGTVYETHAWTFQEMILSRRRIFFARDQSLLPVPSRNMVRRPLGKQLSNRGSNSV